LPRCYIFQQSIFIRSSPAKIRSLYLNAIFIKISIYLGPEVITHVRRCCSHLSGACLFNLLRYLHYRILHMLLCFLQDAFEFFCFLNAMFDESNHDVVVIDVFSLKKLVQCLEFDNLGCLWNCLLWDLAHLSCHDDMTHCSCFLHLNVFNMSKKLLLRENLVTFALKFAALIYLKLSRNCLYFLGLLRVMLKHQLSLLPRLRFDSISLKDRMKNLILCFLLVVLHLHATYTILLLIFLCLWFF